ncbi:hypothetical protein SRABI102_00132 [Stenotrophomonas lactitubi]|nr:hypothetical protein SRABI66_00144 [Stenotrophomonas lactitubi]CAH0128243.1 hypothetical protein SRABI81_00155 [Stenotrophomonas lactitubi]CAH0133957.1 hypothetical protein SRABI102_00132 [Stenotrophomonas lactitubi]CAH0169132.1 hypothetical protein SRABI122_01130 [Stenotrophomonas lactitubi]
MTRLRARTVALLMVVLLLLAGTGVALLWNATHAPSPPAVAFPAPAAEAQARIEHHMAADKAFRDDLLFLLVATLRDRCEPAQAGVLARMANRASLPVLAAVSTVTTQDASLDRPIYQYIQHRADATGCGQPLRLPAGDGGSVEVDIEQYARTFPDSYFDPQRSSAPRDFGGRPLPDRAGNACNSVVYSVLPLGGTDWRCSTLRSNARARVRALCEDEMQRQHGHLRGELDAAVGQAMQDPIVQAVAALPAECR